MDLAELDDLERELGFGGASEDLYAFDQVNDLEQNMKEAWMNERLCPELLPYKQELVDAFKRLVEAEFYDEDYDLEENRTSVVIKLRKELVAFEKERLQFVLCSYLRARILKIQKHVLHILKNQDCVDLLSPVELIFAQQYVNNLAEHLKFSFLNHIPKRFDSLDDDSDDVQMGTFRSYLYSNLN